MPAWLGGVVACLLGLAGLIAGCLFAGGRARWLAHWYFDSEAPRLLRMLPFAQSPLGAFLLCVGIAALLGNSTVHPGTVRRDLMLATALAALLSLALAVVWIVRPPRRGRPAWLRVLELEVLDAAIVAAAATGRRPRSVRRTEQG